MKAAKKPESVSIYLKLKLSKCPHRRCYRFDFRSMTNDDDDDGGGGGGGGGVDDDDDDDDGKKMKRSKKVKKSNMCRHQKTVLVKTFLCRKK